MKNEGQGGGSVVDCLLHNPDDLRTDLNTQITRQVVIHASKPSSGCVETGGLLGLADHKPRKENTSPRYRERPCLTGICRQ